MQQIENLLHSCYLRNACKVPAMAARLSALNGIGQKLRLQASLCVQFLDGPLLPWVGHTEADREFSGVFFSIHCLYQSVPPDIEADSPSRLRRCPR